MVVRACRLLVTGDRPAFLSISLGSAAIARQSVPVSETQPSEAVILVRSIIVRMLKHVRSLD